MDNPDDLIAGMLMLGWLIGTHFGMAAIFRKVDIPLWHAFVPILNGCQLCRVAGITAWWLLMIFVPLANLGFMLYLGIRLSQRFGYADWFGAALGFSGLGLLPVIGFSQRELIAEEQIEQTQLLTKADVIELDEQLARRSTFVALLVLTMLQLICLLCVPGAMIIGAMAFDSVNSITPAMELSIAIAACIPLSILGALIGQWISYSTRKYKLALSMSAVPVLNVIVFIGSVVVSFGK